MAWLDSSALTVIFQDLLEDAPHTQAHPKKHNANNSVNPASKTNQLKSTHSASPNLSVSTLLLPNDGKQMLKEDQNLEQEVNLKDEEPET